MEQSARVRRAVPDEHDGVARNEWIRAGHEGKRRQAGLSVLEGPAAKPDHFVEREGLRFAGTHLIIDFWGASHLDDIATVEAALRRAAVTAKATLLQVELHSFAPSGGVTGVAVLAESHISIHTWPECAYAAIDVFMCGSAEPHRALEVFRLAFEPATVALMEHKRGLMS